MIASHCENLDCLSVAFPFFPFFVTYLCSSLYLFSLCLFTFHPPATYPDSVLGAEVLAETVLEISGDGHQSVSWSGHGFRLTVPAGAVPHGATISLAVKAILSGEFDLPSDCQLMSAIYWIHPSQLFDRDVILHLEHCGVIESEAECSEYQFVAGRCSQADLPYLLKIREGGVFTPHSYEASISVKQFSFYAIRHLGRRRNARASYLSQVFYQPFQGEYVWQVDFVVTRHISSLVAVSVLHCWLLLYLMHVGLHVTGCSERLRIAETGASIINNICSFKRLLMTPVPSLCMLPNQGQELRSGW